jgi:Uma2 family endonuclease
MATQLVGDQSGRLISVEEYLSTSYEPDCEYDNGMVVERNLGEFEHSYLQTILATIFTNNMDRWGVYGLTEQRVQINPRRFLVPDVCVLRVVDPADDIISHPPLIAIEIMSPEDTIRHAAKKAVEYIEFGIEQVWIIAPKARVAYRGASTGLDRVADGELIVPGTPILVQISDLFEKLDRIRGGAGKR